MKLRILCSVFAVFGCAGLPITPEELGPSAGRLPAIKTQEAILPNITYEQMFLRMKTYAEKCLNFSRKVPCGKRCVPSTVRFTPTIITDKNRVTLYLQKKGGGMAMRKAQTNGFYLMSAQALTNGSGQQLMIHGVDNPQHGFITQPTMDWLADKKKVCPKL